MITETLTTEVADSTPLHTSPATRTINVGGKQVTYHVAGKPRAGQPTAVLVHGTGGNTEQHFPFVFPMLARARQVVSVDLTVPEDKDQLELQDLVDQVTAVIHEASNQAVTLVGYSLGAVVAAAVAGTTPSLISQLVLASGWMKSDAHQRLRNDLWRAMWEQDTAAAGAFTAFTALSPAFVNRQSDDELAKIVSSLTAERAFAMQMDLNRRIDISDQVASITAQTLIITCTDDQMVPRHHADQLFGAIENARLAEVRAGHAVTLERPAELVHLIDTFSTDPYRWPTGSKVPSPRP
ncbi:MAG: alpha/beta fold hydrolase [Gulosibacter sp.]|uniref:alpha/beta fold hydrolase n=1 Tax=Gulosibacter sp. TaxID=2817531 RepID=UPI003F92CACB